MPLPIRSSRLAVWLLLASAVAAFGQNRLVFVADRTAYWTGDPKPDQRRPRYILYDGPPNAPVYWWGARYGSAPGDPVPKGRTDAKGFWFFDGKPWRAGADPGLWEAGVSVGGLRAKTLLYVTDRLSGTAAEARDRLAVIHWGGLYPGSRSILEAGAEAVEKLGARNISLALTPAYASRDYPRVDFGPAPHSLAELARTAPFCDVLRRPFRTIVLVAYTFANPSPLLAFDADAEQREIYEFARFLMRAYRGSAKTFILKNWEGDNQYVQAVAASKDAQAGAADTRTMISWLNARHAGLLKAREEIGTKTDVRVLDAVEFNSLDRFRRGEANLLADVVPKVDSDCVSYSAYDSLYRSDNGDLRRRILDDVLLIRHAPGMRNRRLMIGEFGFKQPLPGDADGAKARERARIMTEALVQSGAFLAAYWQISDSGGVDDGFGLLRHDGTRTPAWEAVYDLLRTRPARRLSGSALARPLSGHVGARPTEARP